MATRSSLRKEFRTLLNEVGSSWINDSSDASLMTVNDLLWQAYKHVSKELECFTLHNLGVETIADQEFYEFGAFGYHAADLDKITVSEAANNTDPMTLIAGQPADPYVPEWRVSVSLKNETGGTATVALVGGGTSVTYTVNGRNWAGKTISEAITFTIATELTNIVNNGVVTKYTSKLFAVVTSITCSAATTVATWKRYAGTAETTLGDRVFKPVCLHYDDDELVRLTRGRVLGSNRSFRGLTSDTPGNWLISSEKVFRMVPATTAGEDLYLDGFAYPDAETFDEDTHEPAIDEDDQSLIPLWAAILTTIRDPETPNDARGSVFWPRWSSELAAAKARRRDTGSGEIEIGRYAFYRKHSHRVDEDELTLA